MYTVVYGNGESMKYHRSIWKKPFHVNVSVTW